MEQYILRMFTALELSMGPHEIDALYRWYCTLPATILLFGALLAVNGARHAYTEAGTLRKRNLRFKFDANDMLLLGPFLWLFGAAVVKLLSWLRGGFSNEGILTAFYVFYGAVTVGAITWLLVVFFFQPCMAAVDVLQRGWQRVSQPVDKLYQRHAARWYFVLPLAAIAIAVIAVEKVSDFAFVYKWYYIGPAIGFFYVYLALQFLGAMNRYADEQAGYFLGGAKKLSKWLTVLSIVLIVWIGVYYLFGVEGGATFEQLYAPTVFYGAVVWALCAFFCTWLMNLFLSFFYGLRRVQLRKLAKQLNWARQDEMATICERLRKVAGKQATQSLVKVLHDETLHITARLAAARQLHEVRWQAGNSREHLWLAIGADRWSKVEEMQAEGVAILLEVLDHTLHSPGDAFQGQQLFRVTVPSLQTLGKLDDPAAVASLVRAVQLIYQPELDETHLPGMPDAENANYQAVVATRCTAAHALEAMGPAAASCVATLAQVLREDGLHPQVGEAIAAALKTITPG